MERGQSDATGAIEVRLEPVADLQEYGIIPIAFTVRATYDVASLPDGRFDLVERPVITPYEKDYDRDGEPPASLAARFDVTHWAAIAARIDHKRVGGAIVARDTPGVDLLEGRPDLAVLWDIRVAQAYRGMGVGPALFRAAEAWARKHGCTEMRVETQNINVPACRFYQRMGCQLASVDPNAYPDLPDEVQLIWSKEL